jgi:hypothetical protein
MTENLDMRSVTDMMLTDQGVAVHKEGKEQSVSEQFYATQLADFLSGCNYVDTHLGGVANFIYHPHINNETYTDVAVKFLDIRFLDDDTINSYLNNLPAEELQTVIDTPGFLITSIPSDLETISKSNLIDKVLLFRAWEHWKHEKLYEEYILPSIFIAIRNKSEGDPLYPSMIQSFEEDIRLVHSTESIDGPNDIDLSLFNTTEIDRIEDFLTVVENEYLKTGYFPDNLMLEKKNLGVTSHGKVVLVDSNNLEKSSLSKEERQKLSKESEGSDFDERDIYVFIKPLRKSILRYKENQ